jgi:hypothetical protein
MGYLGIVGGPNPCAIQIESVYAGRPIAFRASPYGVSHDFGKSFVPYLIDPATLEIEWREDLLIGPFSNALGLAAILDDSTMVWHEVGPPSGGSYTSRLRVLTRSGITIAMSGEQQSVATFLPSATVIRLDSSHILRRYNDGSNATVVEVLSVSGSTISLDASTTYGPGTQTVSRDGGEAGSATVTIDSALFPFHYDGSGTLYAFGAASGFAGLPRIHAIPFSLGGSIASPDTSWRSRDAQNVGSMQVAKIGNSECLLAGTPGVMGFYDDGSEMHYLPAMSSTWIVADGFAEQDGETSFGDYPTPDVLEDPPGTDVSDALGDLVGQSGTSLSYAPIAVIVKCPAITGLNFSGAHGPTRHDTALGAVSDLLEDAVTYRLWAFRW